MRRLLLATTCLAAACLLLWYTGATEGAASVTGISSVPAAALAAILSFWKSAATSVRFEIAHKRLGWLSPRAGGGSMLAVSNASGIGPWQPH